VTTSRGAATIHFDRSKAASAVWRKLSGRWVDVTCGTAGRGSGATLRARHRRVRLPVADADACTVATRRRHARGCVPDPTSLGKCVRLVVALTDAGRRHIDEAIAAWDLVTIVAATTAEAGAPDFEELQAGLGDKLVALAGPQASPPPGAIGYWADGDDLAFVVLTAAGERRFVSFADGTYSTNALGVFELRSPPLIPS